MQTVKLIIQSLMFQGVRMNKKEMKSLFLESKLKRGNIAGKVRTNCLMLRLIIFKIIRLERKAIQKFTKLKNCR
jgi:hypothetical protein